MAVLTDSTSRPINGRDGTADWVMTIDDPVTAGVQMVEISFECILNYFSIQELIEMTNADTFCTEGSADQEPGRTQLRFDIRGILKKEGISSGPMIPAPQNVAIVATYSTGCTISFTANFDSARADRIANANALVQATGMSKGAYVVTWVYEPPGP